MPDKMMRAVLRYRRGVIVAVHLALVVFANYLAFWLRFDGSIPPQAWRLFEVTVLPLAAIRGATFMLFRLYQGLWRYTSVWDLRRIIAAAGCSSAVFWGGTAMLGVRGYPLAVIL